MHNNNEMVFDSREMMVRKGLWHITQVEVENNGVTAARAVGQAGVVDVVGSLDSVVLYLSKLVIVSSVLKKSGMVLVVFSAKILYLVKKSAYLAASD
jgi:hypothetical protein